MCYNKLNKNMKIQINNKEIKKVNAYTFLGIYKHILGIF